MTATTGAPAAALARQRDRRTRRPTGLPSWPILLLAGSEKSGKSYACAQASGSALIGRTLWIGIGEDDPDEYGNVTGANFEIVEHDGTYRDILAATEWAVAQPQVDGKPNLIVVDSMTRLWDLLCDMAQDAANRRAADKARKANRPAPADEADIHMDLWNVAKGRWANIIDAIRAHQGPSLVTARMEEVAVIVNGQPSRDGAKALKVKAEKSLPYDVGGTVQMPERGKAYLTGVRTTRMNVPERIPLPKFTVDKLWRDLGLADTQVGERQHSGVKVVDPKALLLSQIGEACAAVGVEKKQVAADWSEAHEGEQIADTSDMDGLRAVLEGLRSKTETLAVAS